MSTKVTHYSDSMEVRPSKPPQRAKSGMPGATTATVLGVVRETTPEEKRAAGLFAASCAIRQDWADGELADVLGALGLR